MRERERERERDRQTDRQTDEETDKETERQRDKETDRYKRKEGATPVCYLSLSSESPGSPLSFSLDVS